MHSVTKRRSANRAARAELEPGAELGAPIIGKRELFPMFVDVHGRKCLVVGAGRIAVAKIEGLLRRGAGVEVVSPHAVRRIRADAQAGRVVWKRRTFSTRDLDGAFLAVAATNKPKVNEAVFRACVARRVLCNSVDDPLHCNFFYPSVVERGPLQIAISTEGCSPALAARLRRDLEKQFGPEWSEWVRDLGEKRREILARKIPAQVRKKLLTEMVVPRAFRAFLRRNGPEAVEPAQGKSPQRGRSGRKLSAIPTR